MEVIGDDKLLSVDIDGELRERRCSEVRSGDAYRVQNFTELVAKIAALQFANPNHTLLFRGQKADYKRNQGSSLAPSLFREGGGAFPSPPMLDERFRRLKEAGEALINLYASRFDHDSAGRLARQQILRWAILQHYEVCQTPLLDVTHSLRIAASFASSDADDEAFIFVLGVPNLSGAVTASAEAGLQIIRLASACPPSALRPHIQEGYLLGEYPEMVGYDQKQLYGAHEIDFGRRLVAKLQFDPRKFWDKSDAFPQVGREALYPDAADPIFNLAQEIKNRLSPE